MTTPTNTTPDDRTLPASPQSSRRWLRVLLAGILVVLIAALAGGTAWSRHLTTRAHQDYAAAAQADTTAQTDLADTVTAATAMLTESTGKTADEQTRTDLAASLKDAEDFDPGDAVDAEHASRADLQEATQATVLRTQRAKDLTAKITTQIQAIRDSMAKKTLADAKDTVTQNIAALQGSADAARAAIDDSSGKVADDQVRVDAETARTTGLTHITQAQKLLAGDDAQALQAMAGTLADASSDIAAKTKALTNAQGAWQQAQDAAVAAAQATTQAPSSQTSSGDSYSDQTFSTGSGGSWTPAPSGGGSGGGSNSTGGNGFPQTVTDPDGHVHHQITPDPDGSYTDDLGNF